jgi:peptidoglycan-associated lipoprotein
MEIKHSFVYCTVLAAMAAGLVGCSTTGKTVIPTTSANHHPQSTTKVDAKGDGMSGQPGRDDQGLSGRIVYFDFDSFVVKPEYQGVIDAQARNLRSHPNSHVTLEGNTDERGSREYNLALGQKRAEAVQRALVLEGASGRQIESVSFGEEKPADPGHDEAAWAKNRRVEFRYH